MGSGKGFGKVILLNEHFVVHGIPAIVSAIGSSTTAVVGPYSGTGWTLDDERNETPGYKKEKAEHQRESVERILKSAGIDTDKNPIHIVLEGDLIAASGVGASAASCAAIARALSDYFALKLSDERINELAFEGEKAYHGSPSGVDNTAATYGGLIWFIRGGKHEGSCGWSQDEKGEGAREIRQDLQGSPGTRRQDQGGDRGQRHKGGRALHE
jgi:mevalonate kinase